MARATNLRGDKGAPEERRFKQNKRTGKTDYDNPLVSFGGAWDKAGREPYIVGYVTSDEDKQNLIDAIERADRDGGSLKILIFPNGRKKSKESPDRIMYIDVAKPKEE